MSYRANTSQPHWQREFTLTADWQDKLNTIWQLQQGFHLKVMQCVDPLAPHLERTYSLAHETKCHNGSRTLSSYTHLTPAFPSITQLEKHASQHSVEILHNLFYGEQARLSAVN